MFRLTKNTSYPLRHSKREGFALIITLSLISFVFLLVITLISQIRLDMSYADARQNQILAKAHARMGMMVALGEIQKHLGPDMRVSTTADIYDDRIESEKDYLTSGYPLNNALSESAELYGSGTKRVELGQRQWTGVWKHRGGWAEESLPSPPLPKNLDLGIKITDSWMYDSSYDPHPAVEQAWLVSGNEGWGRKLAMMKGEIVNEFIEVPDGIIIDDLGDRILNNPKGGVYGEDENPWVDHKKIVEKLDVLSSYHHPLMAIDDPYGIDNPNGSDQSVWLLRAPLLSEDFDPSNVDHQENWLNYIVAEPVKVQKTALHLSDNPRDEDQDIDWSLRSGSYAYWVGDEGVKTKVNVVEPFRIDEGGNIVDLLNEQNRLIVATEPNMEGGSYGFDFGVNSKKDDAQRKDLLTSLSLKSLLEEGTSSESEVSNHHYHSITTDSFGVLSDVRTGGLKRDLSLAFSLDQESKAWKEDFKDNFIFRDRVEYLKNIPLSAQGKRNEWYVREDDATVKDPDALLAGPPWSVLADFHNLQPTDDVLKMQAPNMFPRTTGDNGLIFGRRAPISPRNAFPNARSAYPYFNCFSSAERKIRPEPKNHSILPILTKCKFSMCPIAMEVSGLPSKAEFGLALSPAVTLWNPYNHGMIINDLHLEIPFPAYHGQAGGESRSSFIGLDLKEYDLYRKWWAFVFDRNNTETLDYNDLSSTGSLASRGKIKNKWEPWGIYDFEKGTIDKNSYIFSTTQDTVIKEPGLLSSIKKAVDKPSQADEPYLDPNIGLFNWNNRITPDSLYDIKFDSTKTIYHEIPRESAGDYTFSFKNTKSGKFGFERLVLRIMATGSDSEQVTLLPGEVASFAVFTSGNDLEEAEFSASTATVNVYKWQSGAVERASLLNSGIQIDSGTPETVILQLQTASLGIAGYSDFGDKISAEKFNPDGSRSDTPWSQNDDYEDPICLTLWEGHPDSQNSLPLTKWTSGFSKHAEGKSYSTIEYLKSNLEKLKTTSERTEMIGLGWEISLQMAGDKYNERIPLIEFNTRGLVHSGQHGQGHYFGNLDSTNIKSHISGNYFTDSILAAGGNEYDSDNQLLMNPIFNEQILCSVADKIFVFNNSYPAYIPTAPKNAPDFFKIPSSLDFNSEIPRNFNTLNNVAQRASILGFETSNIVQPIFDPSKNPEFEEPIVVASSGKERVGYLSYENNISSTYVSNISDSSRAVLFEIPESRILSLMQYRHANLNNYIHGPTYALGNSYATTQVARHRSWGRVQNIEMEPTSDYGLRNLVQNDLNYDQLMSYYKELLGDQSFLIDSMGLAIDGWDWDMDFSLGFGPWRSDNGVDQFNYQNTTLDHSYYLNRSLMDGFFLSGSLMDIDHTKEKNAIIGQRFRPYLWDASSGQRSNLSEDLNVSGNHRLIGYIRDNQWENSQSSYGAGSKEKGFSKAKDSEYRFQSVAGDLLLDGAFNINSTSVDAWIAQLSSLRGQFVKNVNVGASETPVIRFLKEPEQTDNEWNKLRVLNDREIKLLAKSMVQQVKHRGPFLSFADFVNRRLAPGPTNIDQSSTRDSRINFIKLNLNEWSKYKENRFTVQGLRGAMQSAIIDAGINDPFRKTNQQLLKNLISQNNKIVYDERNIPVAEGWAPHKGNYFPMIPDLRYDLDSGLFYDTTFGLRAIAMKLNNNKLHPTLKDNEPDNLSKFGAGKTKTIKDFVGQNSNGNTIDIKVHKYEYKSTNFGEAPENLLAVEHLATGANKPGWVMQSDILSPLMPVTSARSDTFIIRVMGETNNDSSAKAWAELVVQRTPDYIKSDLDAPHHRPHEPTKDINLNGYWDDKLGEHWIDLNRNGDAQPRPDLPGVGELGKRKDYRDGMLSDLKLRMDGQEETPTDLQNIPNAPNISYLGINQRFGRKFRIVRFRWLREEDV